MQMLSNLASNSLISGNNDGNAASTTRAAVSNGQLVIRDEGNQRQDVAQLSNDVEHANQTLSPIFDKEKEQKRLQQMQVIAEISSQVIDIAGTHGAIIATKAAKAEADAKAAGFSAADRQRARDALATGDKPNLNPTEADIQQYVYQTTYDKAYTQALNSSGFGTGGAIRQGIMAVSAAVQGLAGGNVAQAIAGAAAPYLATEIKKATTDAEGNVNIAANAVAHAVAGAQAGQNAVENNALSVKENQERAKEMTQCQGDTCSAVIEKYKKINAEQHESVVNCSGAQDCVDKANEVSKLQADYANRTSELLEKARANGGLNPEDQNELSILQVTTIQLEADRNAAIHNAMSSGDSKEAKQLAINSLAQAAGTSAAGIAAGVGKGGNNTGNGTSQVTTKNVDPSILISRKNKNEMSGSQVKRLVKDMKTNGFDANEPVDVAIVNGKAIIIDGHHRAEEAAKAGIKNMPVRIHEVTKEQGDQLLREAAEVRVRY